MRIAETRGPERDMNGTYGASVPEDDRALTERAETTREGSSRYSMASVPSRRGSGLDVASSRGRFVAGAFHVVTRRE